MTADLQLAIGNLMRSAGASAENLAQRGDVKFSADLYQRIEELDGILRRTPEKFPITLNIIRN